MINFNSFVDEMVKISKSRYLNTSSMREALNRLGKRHGSSVIKPNSPKEIKRAYREAVKEKVNLDVPIKERLKAYKHWRGTGNVPKARLGWSGNDRTFKKWDFSISPNEAAHKVRRSEKPVTLYSGGADKSLKSALSNPMTPIDHPVYVPGKTEVSTRGLYASKDVMDATPFAGKGRGAPSVAQFTVPRSQIVQHGYETIVPSNARGIRLGDIMGFERG